MISFAIIFASGTLTGIIFALFVDRAISKVTDNDAK